MSQYLQKKIRHEVYILLVLAAVPGGSRAGIGINQSQYSYIRRQMKWASS